jgi:translation initiation factor 2B subunit (eIF-2B alpha/beta/delta family)
VYSVLCIFQAKLFNDCILKIEGDQITAIETLHHVKQLEDTLKRRSTDNFLTSRTKHEKSELIKTGIGRATLEGVCRQFFGWYSNYPS